MSTPAQDTVRELQATLKGDGYYLGPLDGIPGDRTQKAVAQLFAEALTSDKPAAIDDDGEPVDERSEKAIATLHPSVRPLIRALVRKAAGKGITIKITSGTRTYGEQNALYAQGRTAPGRIVTNAKGGYSSHNFGTAADFTIFKGSTPVWESPAYKTVGEIAKSLGLSWGGDWSAPDEPHVYLKPKWATGMSESAMMAGLRVRHDAGDDAFA